MTLLEAAQATLRRLHASRRTEEAYLTCTHGQERSAIARLPKTGTDLRTLQTLLGHSDLRTTMIYTHIVDCGPLGVVSPLDRQEAKGRGAADRRYGSPPRGTNVAR
jgi:integrase